MRVLLQGGAWAGLSAEMPCELGADSGAAAPVKEEGRQEGRVLVGDRDRRGLMWRDWQGLGDEDLVLGHLKEPGFPERMGSY